MSKDIDLLAAEAAARAGLHQGQESQRQLSQGYEMVGLAGELAFAQQYGQPLNWHRGHGGDGGVDFVVPLAYTIGIKTYRKAFNLIQEQGKVVADIYVLAEYVDDTKRARLLGWGWGSKLRAAPVKDFGDFGIPAHYLPREALRPMGELAKRIMVVRPL